MPDPETKVQYLILVDENDQPTGKLEKLETHRLGLLHRAFSVFIFNRQGELLLQQRSDEKYHSPGLWTNTCCSHPEYGEELTEAVKRRLYAEMGMIADTKFAFTFLYKATLDNQLTEHELDHVFIGVSDVLPKPDPSEARDWKYMSPESISIQLEQYPEHFTVWFRICFKEVVRFHQQLFRTIYGV
jgi:isopentenyl-diphosphate delta-isomerase